MRKLFTSESVTEGHPDKVCDSISDAILDAFLAKDKDARVACECAATTNFLLIMGEITTSASVDIESVARQTIANIGYTDSETGFDFSAVQIVIKINKQSADIALGVDHSQEFKNTHDKYDLVGAGDQGMMFGYATDETPELMPYAIVLSHRLSRRLSDVRKNGIINYLKPDGKCQVTVAYENNIAVAIDTVIVSSQHNKHIDIETLRFDIKKHVIDYALPKELLSANTKIFINPTGRFEIGGPTGDSGLTGRKIIVDTYGGYCAHGGGAFSGKDPTKVDRSAAYMARYVAKNIVASGLARECTIEVAYAIGVARPVSLFVNTNKTGIVNDERITDIVLKEFDFRPQAIIEKFNLKRPIYEITAVYGHFGRNGFPWEELDSVAKLKKYM